jgi:hypothetical protein
MERLQSAQRFAIHWRSIRQLDLFVDVHGTRRKCNSIGHGLRQFACTHGPSQRGSQLGGEWIQLDAHLVCHECDGLYGIGRMERQQSAQRFAIHRCAHCQCDLRSHVYRYRRQRCAVRKCFRQTARPHRRAERGSKRYHER